MIELRGVQFGMKLYAWFQNRTGSIWKHKYDFRPKILRHEVQLPLYYIHFKIAQIEDLVHSNVLLTQYWARLKFNSYPIFWGEKVRVQKQKLQNLSFTFLQFERLL